MSLSFLAKKTWHTQRTDNVEQVWLAEQKKEIARLNGVDDSRLALFCADGSDDDDLPADCDGTVDCVVANILVGPVTQLAPLFARYAKKGSGRVCVSGVLATQVPTVRDAYGEWFDDLSHEEEGGWAVVSGVRNSTPAP